MFCAISGEPPQEPVVSKKSGQVYEKRLIIKYIADYGKDPISGEDITEEDLLEIKGNPKTVKPRPATLTSIPSLLSVFQNEWDSSMLETFTIKQQYQQVRQELSQALYQHDAACRVIARLMKERDAAREALAKVQAHIAIKPPPEAAAADSQAMEVEEQDKGVNEAVINKLNETSAVLSKNRKRKKPPPELTPADVVKEFIQVSSISSLHGASASGVTCMDVDQAEQLILTGGNDKKALILNKHEGKIAATLKGHTKKVTNVLWLGNPNDDGYDTAFTASADKTIRIWNKSNTNYKATVLPPHSAEVTGISVHPTKDYLVSVSNDSTWAFHDIHTAQALAKIESNDVTNGYSTVEIHPDGLILATGTNDSIVRIWDIKGQKNVTSFSDHVGRITSIAFSENGYYLATASECNLVKLWDLRRLLNLHTIQLEEGSKINKICWDYSGQYLGVGGTDIRIYQAKSWNELAIFTDNTADITGMKFGELAKNLYASGLDRTLRIYGVDTEE